ncbi:hypothetical protein Tco_1468076 [Tanacetum coccineum]
MKSIAVMGTKKKIVHHTEDTDDEEADEECNGCVKAADYSDEESITENGDFVKEEDYTEDKALYCDEGWFIGWKV